MAGSKRRLQQTYSPQPKSQKLPHQHTQKGWSNNAEEWRLAMARTGRRKRLLPKTEMTLPNHFGALQTEEETSITPGKMLELRQPHLLPVPPAGVWALSPWDSLGETWSVRDWWGPSDRERKEIFVHRLVWMVSRVLN